MLICNKCYKENLDIAKFCKECGSSNLYDPQAQEKLEKERQRLEELKRIEEERKRKIEEEIKITQEKIKKKLKQRKEFIIKHKGKIIASVVILFLIALASAYQYFYGGKYSRIYISKLESKCHNDEASCKILQNIYKEKCDEGDGKACFANIFMSRHSIIIKLNGAYGLIDKNGKTIMKPEFDEINGFSEGLAGFRLNEKWGIIDENGKIIIEPKFDYIYSFKEGLAGFKLNEKYGFIDKNGKIIAEPKFDYIYNFEKGLARVKLNGKYGFIDKNGKVVIEPKFDNINFFEEGLAKVKLKWRIWFYK